MKLYDDYLAKNFAQPTFAGYTIHVTRCKSPSKKFKVVISRWDTKKGLIETESVVSNTDEIRDIIVTTL